MYETQKQQVTTVMVTFGQGNVTLTVNEEQQSHTLDVSVAEHFYHAHDISDAASLLHLVRTGDQPYSDWASSVTWQRPQRPVLLSPCCLTRKLRGLAFIYGNNNTEEPFLAITIQDVIFLLLYQSHDNCSSFFFNLRT